MRSIGRMGWKRIGSAELTASNNDLIWKYSFYTDDLVWVKLFWWGYNDSYWWNEVAPTEDARTIKGEDGRKYSIDFKTCDVFAEVR